MFGKGSKQQELINSLGEEFVKLQRRYKIPQVSFFFFFNPSLSFFCSSTLSFLLLFCFLFC